MNVGTSIARAGRLAIIVGMFAGVALAVAPAATAAEAPTATAAGLYSCRVVSTEDKHGYAECAVHSGQIRLRADCPFQPDRYSDWVGRGVHTLRTPNCIGSIRNSIIEARG